MSKYDTLADAQIDQLIDEAYQRGYQVGVHDLHVALRAEAAERKEGKDATPRKKQ